MSKERQRVIQPPTSQNGQALLAFAMAELNDEGGAPAIRTLLEEWLRKPVDARSAGGRGEDR